MSFPYMNEQQNSVVLDDHGVTKVYNIMEVTHEAELAEAHHTTVVTDASSTVAFWTVTLEDGAAAGTGSTAMATVGGTGTAMTALTTLDFSITEGTINAGDQLNVNQVADTTAALNIQSTLSLNWIQGLPAGVGVAA